MSELLCTRNLFLKMSENSSFYLEMLRFKQVTFQMLTKFKVHKKEVIRLQVCRAALVRSALENPDPGASNAWG